MANNWWRLGKFIYSLPLVVTGFLYVLRPQSAVETLTSFIPGGLNLIYVAGILWIILGLMLAFDLKTKYASFGVIGLLVAYQIMVHIPALYTGEHLHIVWFELLRDLSLMGGAFFILATEDHQYSHLQPRPHEELNRSTF